MSPPSLPDRSEFAEVLEKVTEEARSFLAAIDERTVRLKTADRAARTFGGSLPESGSGAVAALAELIERGGDAVIGNAGPRFYHYVIGGVTPAALGAEWLVSLYDQLAFAWITSPLAVRLEQVSFSWLRELFGLPPGGVGYMTTGAMMANYNCLLAARQWWGERHGVDIAYDGLTSLPKPSVFSSGYLHATSWKALAMLGMGRNCVQLFSRDDIGRLDAGAMEDALQKLDGEPAILIGNAGEVNAGDFDPIGVLADLAERHNAWLHVDGAFGLFCRASPDYSHLADGVERADSITVDGHKWLNIPYDCGFALVNEARLLSKSFTMFADYLPEAGDEARVPANIGAESSRRARALAVWANLRAYGREGVRTWVENHCALARHLARRVDEASDLERLAEVPLNIVCFRFNPGGKSEDELNRINERLGEAILEDGRVYAGTTRYRGAVALRPAIVNWRTGEHDIDFFVEVVRELGSRDQ